MSPFLLRCKKIEGPSHYIIVISTKIDKRATKRNRIRRLIRESLRHLVPNGLDIICIVKKNISYYSYKEVETIIQGLLHETTHT